MKIIWGLITGFFCLTVISTNAEALLYNYSLGGIANVYDETDWLGIGADVKDSVVLPFVCSFMWDSESRSFDSNTRTQVSNLFIDIGGYRFDGKSNLYDWVYGYSDKSVLGIYETIASNIPRENSYDNIDIFEFMIALNIPDPYIDPFGIGNTDGSWIGVNDPGYSWIHWIDFYGTVNYLSVNPISQPEPVPEPSTVVLIFVGLLFISLRLRKGRRAKI